ncbi:MAG: lipase family protein [Leptolyngbyaceae bacterium]|nr:lipase family protein [Leptolyngbyaceae bacterium]
MKPIEPYKTSLSPNNAYWMATLADLVYHRLDDGSPDEKTILDRLQAEDDEFLSVTGASNQSAQGILVEHDDYFCLAFRGTDELDDWMDNFNVFPQKVFFGEFHRGFWNSVEDIWEKLETRYRELRESNKRPLFLTGHSKGGAMATVAAAKLIHRDWPFTSVYTFGQPRAMTAETARIFNVEAKGKFFRFQNNNDLVTRAPARLMGYSHVGTYVHISDDATICLEPGFWLRFLDQVDGAMGDLGEIGIDGVKDHDMKHYLAAVSQWNLVFS